MEYFLEHCSGSFWFRSDYSIWLIFFFGGIIGSITHCSAMCSPFVLMQISHDPSSNMPILQRLSSLFLLPYHLGRITTYIFLSMIISGFSSSFVDKAFYQKIGGIFLIFSGIIFISKALNSYSFSFFERNFIFRKWGEALGFLTKALIQSQDFSSRYFLGFILGFLPCGLVFAALMMSASMGNVVNAMIGMFLFALGTVPVLLCIGFFGRIFIQKRGKFFSFFLPIAMCLNGLSLLVIAYYKIIT